MIISLIVAAGANNVIGKDSQLPWQLPADMKYFKNTTTGHTVIMGRGTFESLGKPLPNRKNIVVTRQQNFHPEGCTVLNSLEAAISSAKDLGEQEAFIIGGGDIFRQSIVWADRIYLTRIFHEFEGDTFFPEMKSEEWRMISEAKHEANEKNRFSYAFQVFERK